MTVDADAPFTDDAGQGDEDPQIAAALSEMAGEVSALAQAEAEAAAAQAALTAVQDEREQLRSALSTAQRDNRALRSQAAESSDRIAILENQIDTLQRTVRSLTRTLSGAAVSRPSDFDPGTASSVAGAGASASADPTPPAAALNAAAPNAATQAVTAPTASATSAGGTLTPVEQAKNRAPAASLPQVGETAAAPIQSPSRASAGTQLSEPLAINPRFRAQQAAVPPSDAGLQPQPQPVQPQPSVRPIERQVLPALPPPPSADGAFVPPGVTAVDATIGRSFSGGAGTVGRQYIYWTEDGDTILTISRQVGVSANALLRANSMTLADATVLLPAGTGILVPEGE